MSRRSAALTATLFLLSLLLPVPARAALSSQSTHGSWWTGNVRVDRDDLRVTLHAGYIEVEEDVVLAPAQGWSGAPVDAQTSLEITGTFDLPQGSVLVGCLLWNGNTILQAKLKATAQARAEYEDVVDRNTAPPPLPRDPMIIERLFDDQYRLAVYPVAWGGSRHFRMRYLVPFTNSAGTNKYPIQPLFLSQDPAGATARFRLDLNSDEPVAAKLEKNGVLIPVSFPGTRIESAASASLFLRDARIEGSFALGTSFDEGEWKGSYMLYRGQVPDSLLNDPSLRVEVVFLWKWNDPKTFVGIWHDYYGGSGRQPSYWGSQAIDQARRIRRAATQLTSGASSNRVGMVFDQSDSKPSVFPLGGRGSQELRSLTGFLDGIDENYLLGKYAGTSEGGSGSGPSAAELARLRAQGAQEFTISLRHAFSLYSPDSGILKHLVVVTAGPDQGQGISAPAFESPDWFRGVSVSAAGHYGSWSDFWSYEQASWTGVPLADFIGEHVSTRPMQYFEGWSIPSPKRVGYSIDLQSATRTYTLDGAPQQVWDGQQYATTAQVEISAHAATPWKHELVWRVYDEEGRVLSTRTETPNWIEKPRDTALAKIWAGSRQRFSEVYPSGELGSIYGFVDRSYALLALESDSLGTARSAAYRDSGVPDLAAGDIFRVVPSEDPGDLPGELAIADRTSTAAAKLAVVRLVGQRGVAIQLASLVGEVDELSIIDLQGRVLARWSARDLRGMSQVSWNGRDLRGALAPAGLYFVVARTAKGKIVQQFSLI